MPELNIESDQRAVHEINHILHLANDLSMAYATAARRIGDATLREELLQLDHSHDRHRVELGDWVRLHGGREAGRGDWHGIVERIRVVVGDLEGDEGILRAMATNEHELRAAMREAHERPGMPRELQAILGRALDHEQLHELYYQRALASRAD